MISEKEENMGNIIFCEDIEYVQSANALFHFMKEQKFLEEALNKKALVPRYCKEDVGYLELEVNNTRLEEIAVLQKCFCDISFHNFFNKIPLSLTGESTKLNLTYEQLRHCEENNTHIGFYGEYAIAFSKKWCIENNLQPIHYLNTKSQLLQEYKAAFDCAMNDEDIDERIDEDIINRMVYFKPLQGTMVRFIDDLTEIQFAKNFHDEKEWRFVPKTEELTDKAKVIVGGETLKSLASVNDSLENDEFKKLWLEFKYEDIKYLIVPSNDAKINIINFIDGLNESKYTKYDLISKIEVLSQIRKDW